VPEGTLRGAAWVDGTFMDAVVLGQLAAEWRQAGSSPAR
jgi:RimJ/RimL family protein N-acetyltransferase